MIRSRLALLVDVVCVLGFVVLGRTSHAEGEAVLGTLGVAAPFLVGLGVAWTVALPAVGRRREPPEPAGLPAGAVVLACVVVLGMVGRRLAGGGTPVSFVLVATAFLALFLLGWRLVAARLAGRFAQRTVRRRSAQ